MSLSGKHAVVTGGGSGIGRAVVQALSEAGAEVMLAGRRFELVDEVAAELRVAGRKAHACRCDVTDAASVSALYAAATKQMPHVDILVNCAGIAVSAPFKAETLESWNRHFLVNATGAFLCCQVFLPGMIERRAGRIVNLASVAGLSGAKYITAYAASKHALVGFTRALAAEVADKGVTVNAVCPGFVDTDLTRQSVDRIVEKTGMTRDEALASLAGQSPQKRLMTPAEIAHAVLSLCHEGARGVNGQAIVVDGGALVS